MAPWLSVCLSVLCLMNVMLCLTGTLIEASVASSSPPLTCMQVTPCPLRNNCWPRSTLCNPWPPPVLNRVTSINIFRWKLGHLSKQLDIKSRVCRTDDTIIIWWWWRRSEQTRDAGTNKFRHHSVLAEWLGVCVVVAKGLVHCLK